MPTLHCTVGEGFRVGEVIRVNLTGRLDDTLYLFIEAAWGNALEGTSGFHASAPCEFGWNAHVLAVRDGDTFEIGPVHVRIEDARDDASPAQPLRDVRLHVQAPDAMPLAHIPRARPARLQRRAG